MVEEDVRSLRSGRGTVLGRPSRRSAPVTLLVDDDVFFCALLRRSLENLGVTDVVTVHDSAPAHDALCGAKVFDLVICDLRLPGGDGVALMRELWTLQPQAAVVVASSADERILAGIRELARVRGARLLGALSKPVTTEQLRRVLEQLADPADLPEAPATVAAPTALELARALERGEIGARLQPQIDVRSGQLVGAEALARWRRGEGDWVPPCDFIRLAEATGQIARLTDVIVADGLRASADWHRRGLAVQLSLNLSAAVLQHVDWADHFLKRVRAFGIPPAHITVEVTESELASDLGTELDVLTRLRLHDVELSIDDFGTGYSSLEQLLQMPFTELKLDRSFVSAAGHDPRAHQIIDSTARLAREFRLRTVAEGVESAADCDVVRAIGCDWVQGYHVSRALEPARFLDWSTGWARQSTFSAR